MIEHRIGVIRSAGAIDAMSPSKVKLANMSPKAPGMLCASNAVAQLPTEPP